MLAWSASLGKLQVSLYLPGEKITLGTACNYSSSPPAVQLQAKYLVIREPETMRLGLYLAPCHSPTSSQPVCCNKGPVSPTPRIASSRSFHVKTGPQPATGMPPVLCPRSQAEHLWATWQAPLPPCVHLCTHVSTMGRGGGALEHMYRDQQPPLLLSTYSFRVGSLS